MKFHNKYLLYIRLNIAIILTLCACSNSNYVENVENYNTAIETDDMQSNSDNHSSHLPIDGTEFPYTGIPRIVIETENFQAIKNRETEIPAKLQIWGEHAPESKVMDLTIRGRGNSTWGYPKKPYAIKFKEKQAFLGMPKAKKWVMLANYRDRTLIRNALAFEIARQTSQAWVPQGRFVDVYLNKEFIGNYYICEKIEVAKNRLTLNEGEFLIEFDKKYDEEYKFKSSFKSLPVNIKYPKEPSNYEFDNIHNFIDTVECILYENCYDLNIQNYIDLQSFASYLIIQEITQNEEIVHPKSVYAYKDSTLHIGPVWDYDWQTFTSFKSGIRNAKRLWYDALKKQAVFKGIIKAEWDADKDHIMGLSNFIDSIANYTSKSNEMNYKLWPINLTTFLSGDEDKDFNESILSIKKILLNRMTELDSLFNLL